MNIKVKQIGDTEFANVNLEHDNLKIDLGRFDEDDRISLLYDLLDTCINLIPHSQGIVDDKYDQINNNLRNALDQTQSLIKK